MTGEKAADAIEALGFPRLRPLYVSGRRDDLMFDLARVGGDTYLIYFFKDDIEDDSTKNLKEILSRHNEVVVGRLKIAAVLEFCP